VCYFMVELFDMETLGVAPDRLSGEIHKRWEAPNAALVRCGIGRNMMDCSLANWTEESECRIASYGQESSEESVSREWGEAKNTLVAPLSSLSSARRLMLSSGPAKAEIHDL
jgi:hypothetical protein